MLLDRDAELDVLQAVVGDLQDGRGTVLVLEGPAGIGKTALLDAAVPQDGTVLTLRARASELDRTFPHGIVHQLFGPPLRAADAERRERLLGGGAGFLAGSAPPTDAFAVLHGLHWLVLELAAERPLLLLVDDLHWADEPSLRFLEHLGRRLDLAAVAVIATLRPGEPGAPEALLDELAAGPAARTVRPGPLRGASVATVLETALGVAPDAGFAEAVAAATGGNPLLATVVAGDLALNGIRGTAKDGSALDGLRARGIAPVVRRRLRSLGPDATTLAQAAAVLGDRADGDDLVALAGLAPEPAQTARAALVAAEVLAPSGSGFVHPLVGAAVLDGCPPAERARLHVAAARRLRDRGAVAPIVAVHRRLAPPAGDADAVEDLLAAARAAAAEGAADAACDLAERALAEPPTAAARPDVALTLGELEVLAGRAAGPPRLQALLAAGLSGDRAARAGAALGTQLVHTVPARAAETLRAALAEAEDPRLTHQLEAHLLEALVLGGGGEELDARLAAGRTDQAASPALLAHVAVEVACQGANGADVLALARRATADSRLVAEVGPATSTWNLAAHALRFGEAATDCARFLEAGERAAQERGSRAAVLFVEHAWGYWHRDFGSVATGAARAQLGLEVIRELGLALTVPALQGILAENLVHRDRIDEALAHIDIPLTETEGTYIEPFALSARALARLAARRFEDAEVDLRRLVDLADARGWTSPHAVRGRLRLAGLLAQTGRAEEALAVSDVDLAAAERIDLPGVLGAVLRVRAQALDGADATDALEAAVAALRPTELRLELGWALHDLGVRMRVQGHRRDAREHLRRALDLAARTGSQRLARHVRGELDASGARPQRDRMDGVEGLTPSELRAAELAAGGLTNREIAQTLWITPKTVEMHLGRSYAKLGIRSRRGLAGALAPA